MKSTEQDAVVKQLLINAIEAENLLIQKYQTYTSFIKDSEFQDLMREFEQNSQEHISLLRDKMERLSML